MAHEIHTLDLTSPTDASRYDELKRRGSISKEADFFGIGSTKEDGAYPIIMRVVDLKTRSEDSAIYQPPIC